MSHWRNLHDYPSGHGSECWPIEKKDADMVRIFERIILRRIYGPINDNGIWKTRYLNELYTLYDGLDLVEVIEIGRFSCLGHLLGGQVLDPCRKLIVLKPEGTRRLGKPKLRWLDSVEEDVNMGERNWRSK